MYICIDLKTFYASVECAERGLDPFTTNLVVADPERSHTTICLAITPALKALGVKNRCRLFEIPKGIEYITAKPRMKLYMQRSADIYAIYLRYISPEDIHVYSIDECFIDATPYLELYGTDACGLARFLMEKVREKTGITATAGVGTNLFLAKVALDITAKHEKDGVGYLDQAAFKEKIWHHRPITDIWNVGPGIARRLAEYGVYDLAGVAQLKPETLFKEFGVNAEFLIDHARGIEPCTMAQIKAYRPESNGLGNGQVLPRDYTFDEALVVLREMVDTLVLDLAERHCVASGISLSVGYAKTEAEKEATRRALRDGAVFEGGHGARVGRGAHTGGQRRLSGRTGSFRKLWVEFEALYRETTDSGRAIRRLSTGLTDIVAEEFEELYLFADADADARERDVQRAVLAVKERFGKNALLKGTSLREGATGRERNEQVGGHHA